MKKTYEYKTTSGAAISLTIETIKIEGNITLDGQETNTKEEPVWAYKVEELLVNGQLKKGTFKNLDMTIISLGKQGKNEILLAVPAEIIAEVRSEQNAYNLARFDKIVKELEIENAKVEEEVAVYAMMDASEDRVTKVKKEEKVATVSEVAISEISNKMKKTEYNLNNESIFLSSFDFGEHYGIEVKLGNKIFIMDIDKNCSIACIDFYKKSEVGKYEQVSPILSLWFEGDAIITKDKALNFEEMKNAQDIYFRYNREILKFK